MKTRIQKLIDGLFIQPLTTAITNKLQGGFTTIMTDLTELKASVADLKQAVLDEHTRIDARLDTLTKQLEAKATEHDDPELTTLASDIRAVTAGLTAFHPAEAPAASGSAGDQTGGQGGNTPPAGGDTP